jgi:Ca2+-binding EF-hand superfamily protein
MTDKIIDKTKREKMNDVFDLLDSDSDGLISSKRIDIETIPGEVLEVFTPLL